MIQGSASPADRARAIRRRRQRQTLGRGVLVLALLIAGYLAYRQFAPPSEPPERAESAGSPFAEAPGERAVGPEPTAAPPSPAEPAPAPAAPARVELPPLDESDGLVRERALRLARGVDIANWLAGSDLVRRFTAAVDNVAEGRSPRKHVPELGPSREFDAVVRDGRLYVDPASYRRYDAVTRAVTALDAAACAGAYRALHPLFQRAYTELGYPDGSFDDALARAIRRLLDAPIPASEPELVAGVLSYDYADPELEGLSAAEKHLLRMGPANARAIQKKLREIGGELGLAVGTTAVGSRP